MRLPIPPRQAHFYFTALHHILVNTLAQHARVGKRKRRARRRKLLHDERKLHPNPRHNNALAGKHAVNSALCHIPRRHALAVDIFHIGFEVEFGRNRAGAERADLHRAAALAQLLPDSLRKLQHICLRRVISRHQRAGQKPRGGRNVEYITPVTALEIF